MLYISMFYTQSVMSISVFCTKVSKFPQIAKHEGLAHTDFAYFETFFAYFESLNGQKKAG